MNLIKRVIGIIGYAVNFMYTSSRRKGMEKNTSHNQAPVKPLPPSPPAKDGRDRGRGRQVAERRTESGEHVNKDDKLNFKISANCIQKI